MMNTEREAMKLALEALERANETAMLFSLRARVPECGEFAAIAQDLDWSIETLRQALEQPSNIEAAVKKESEACAVECDKLAAVKPVSDFMHGCASGARQCAATIRARVK